MGGHHGLDLIIAVDDGEDVQQLAFVFMDALHLQGLVYSE